MAERTQGSDLVRVEGVPCGSHADGAGPLSVHGASVG